MDTQDLLRIARSRELKRVLMVCSWGLLTLLVSAVVAGLPLQRRILLLGNASDFFAWMFVGTLGLVAILVVLAIGQLRSGHPIPLLKKALGAAGGLLLLAVVGIGALTPLHRYLTLDAEMRVSFGADPPERGGAMYVRIDGTTGPSLPDLLRNGLTASVPIGRVYLANAGGDVGAALEAAAVLKEHGVTLAVVDGLCESACAFMAALFERRAIVQGAGALGYHDIRSYTGNKIRNAGLRDRLAALILANGVSQAAIDYMFASIQMRHPDLNDLLQSHLVTACWDTAALSETRCESPSDE